MPAPAPTIMQWSAVLDEDAALRCASLAASMQRARAQAALTIPLPPVTRAQSWTWRRGRQQRTRRWWRWRGERGRFSDDIGREERVQVPGLLEDD